MCGRAKLCALMALVAAAPLSIAQDKLRIQGIPGGESVVVMIRNAAGCGSEQILRSRGETTFGNLRPSPGCPIDLAIFSESNAMYFESPVNAWTGASNEVHTVKLEPLIEVPVSVWVMDDATAVLARQDLAKAGDLFRRNRAGVRFAGSVRKFSEVSADSSASRIVREGIRRDTASNDLVCEKLGAIRGREFNSPDRLNVYYVDDSFTGRNCAILATPSACTGDAAAFPAGDGNISFIGTRATVVTLSHELGHAFGLRPSRCGAHTNDLPGFSKDNIMAVPPPNTPRDGDTRSSFSLGQVFRMNTQEDGWGGTMLIKNRSRQSPVRECPLNLPKSALCPALATPWPN